MANREVDSTLITRVVEAVHPYVEALVDGQVATDGIQYSAVATVGTTALAVFTKTVDPGYEMGTKKIEVGLTAKFTELVGGTTNASVGYHWEVRERSSATLGAWATISPQLTKGVASLSNWEDTVSGYLNIGTLPRAPFDIRLVAQALVAASFEGKVKSGSFVRVVGAVIPGT